MSGRKKNYFQVINSYFSCLYKLDLIWEFLNCLIILKCKKFSCCLRMFKNFLIVLSKYQLVLFGVD